MARKYVARDFSKIKDPTRLFDLLENYELNYPEQTVALGGKQTGKWQTYSPKEYREYANNISYGLMALGVQTGDKVAIIASNRPEWNMLDMGIMQIGAVSVPVYPTVSENDYKYILNHCEAKVVFMEGAEVMKKINAVKDELPACLQHIYTFVERKDYETFDQFIELGKQNQNPEALQNRKDAVMPNDCATIVYTSGTTGTPKGVMLSHNNFITQVMSLRVIPSAWSNRVLSFLPLCHVYERMLVFLYQYLGMSVYYVQNLGTIAENIKEVVPTMMSAVPRVLEKFYDKIYDNGKKLSGFKQKLFYWAIDVAKEYKIESCDRTLCYKIKSAIARKLVWNTIAKGIGGDFDIVVSGSAAIPSHLVSFFTAIGMPVFEGYGLTETSPVIAVSQRLKFSREAGTVGFPLPGVDVRIAENGEVICKGPNIMLGYYKSPELTAEVIDKDRWFHTGDLGKFTEKGQLMLTGRIKALFKTAFGKYVNPQVLENTFGMSPFIDNIVVFGENQKFPVAIVSPNFEFMKLWCSRHDVEYTTPEEMVKNKTIIARFKREFDKYNAQFGDTEQIKKFDLVTDEWSIGNGILTPTLKVKRKVVEEKYQENIKKLYA
ncbi:MAG: long-chain fatty acid--CoA ligase [Bacteroidales bacterium]|nr:long-chain fatty acid--CoA ligase [Bacteroidales bacterium]